MLRVAIIGVGTMGHVHTDAYQQMPDVDLVGVYDADPARAQAFAEARGLSTVYPSAEALIGDVDVVDVCTPTPAHAEYVLAALYAGRDVVCEKPMARSLADCARLIAAAKESGRTLMPAQVLRFFPEYSSATAVIRQGAVGNPATIRTRRGGPFPRATNDWYGDFAQSGGVTLDTIIHDFDWLRWTFGEVEYVYAKASYYNHPTPLDHLDYSLVTLKFRSGAVAQVEGTWAEPGSFSVFLEVCGDAGMIHFDSMESVPLRVNRRQQGGAVGGVAVPESPTSANGYYLELRHFIDCVQAGTTPTITPVDGYYAVEIALAALESARTGKRVAIQGPPARVIAERMPVAA